MKILIPTCNDYISHVEALQHSTRNTVLNSFDFIIIGYESPKFKLDPNWSFVSMGKQRGATYWSNDMNKFLESFSDETFIIGNDDCAISYIDKERLLMAIWTTNTYKSVGRFALMAEGRNRPTVPFFVSEDESVQPVIKVNQFTGDADYRLALGWSVWSKNCFLAHCQNGQDPWAFEKSSCSGANQSSLANWNFLTFNPDGSAIDGAFFRRKHIPNIIPDWDKGYYGHDLEGQLREDVKNILFK